MVQTQWPLVGREHELAEVWAALGYAGSDRPAGGVVLLGGPGVGKTRLLRSVVAGAGDRGWSPELVAATRATDSIPSGAVSHLLPADAKAVPGGALAFTPRLSGVGRRPLLVAVDDAHLLTESSAGLVHYLAVHRVATVVLAVRSDRPVPDALAAVWQHGPVTLVEVGPLPDTAIDALLDHALGGQVRDSTRLKLRRLAAGSPLYLRELLLAGTDSGALRYRDGGWRWQVPPLGTTSLRERVQLRLATATAPAPAPANVTGNAPAPANVAPANHPAEQVTADHRVVRAVVGRVDESGDRVASAVAGQVVADCAARLGMTDAGAVGGVGEGGASRAAGGAARAWMLLFDGHVREALVAASAVQGAAAGSPESRLWARAAAVTASAMLGATAHAVRLADEGLRLAYEQATEPLFSLAHLRLARGQALLLAGRLGAAREEAERGYQQALITRDHGLTAQWAVLRGVVAQVRGDLPVAVASLREITGYGKPGRLRRLHLIVLAGVLAMSGDVAAAERWLRCGEELGDPLPRAFQAQHSRSSLPGVLGLAKRAVHRRPCLPSKATGYWAGGLSMSKPAPL